MSLARRSAAPRPRRTALDRRLEARRLSRCHPALPLVLLCLAGSCEKAAPRLDAAVADARARDGGPRDGRPRDGRRDGVTPRDAAPDARLGTWQVVASPTLQTLVALWGRSARELWAVSEGGAILRGDGAGFRVETTVNATLAAVTGNASEVYTVGSPAAVFRLSVGTWQRLVLPGLSTERLLAAHSPATGEVWVGGGALGAGGALALRYRDGQWLRTGSGPPPAAFSGIWSAGSQMPVWALGEGSGTILRFDGQRWATAAIPTAYALLRVGGRAASETYAVGREGALVRFDGAAWGLVGTFVPGGALHGLAAPASTSDAWAVGELQGSGVALRFDGRSWQKVALPMGTPGLRDLWGPSATELWAVGVGGVILRYRAN